MRKRGGGIAVEQPTTEHFVREGGGALTVTVVRIGGELGFEEFDGLGAVIGCFWRLGGLECIGDGEVGVGEAPLMIDVRGRFGGDGFAESQRLPGDVNRCGGFTASGVANTVRSFSCWAMARRDNSSTATISARLAGPRPLTRLRSSAVACS